jgi:hypothetical protein
VAAIEKMNFGGAVACLSARRRTKKIELKTDSNELNGHIRAHPGDSRRGEGREKKL